VPVIAHERAEADRLKVLREIGNALGTLAVAFDPPEGTTVERAVERTQEHRAIYQRHADAHESGALAKLEKPALEAVLEELNGLRKELFI
jgi:hypothetical protein